MKEKPLHSKNIAIRRKALSLSGHDLAELADIPYPTLRDIEAGYNNGRIATLEKIAKALKCTLSDLYQDPKTSTKTTPESFSKLSDDQIKELASSLVKSMKDQIEDKSARDVVGKKDQKLEFTEEENELIRLFRSAETGFAKTIIGSLKVHTSKQNKLSHNTRTRKRFS